ncbi:hypothetical protein Q7P37_006370 [Cladosporium fusiforme]
MHGLWIRRGQWLPEATVFVFVVSAFSKALYLGFLELPTTQLPGHSHYHLGNTSITYTCILPFLYIRWSRRLSSSIVHPHNIAITLVHTEDHAHESQLPNRNSPNMSKQFTANDVKENGSVEKGLHIIIDNNVYEMGGFVDEHPGGAKILKRVGGKDASKQFWKYHNESVLKKYQDRLKVGTLKEASKL